MTGGHYMDSRGKLMRINWLNGDIVHVNDKNQTHNLNGPAIYNSVSNKEEYWIEGIKFDSVEKYNRAIKLLIFL